MFTRDGIVVTKLKQRYRVCDYGVHFAERILTIYGILLLDILYYPLIVALAIWTRLRAVITFMVPNLFII